ncbi:MAG: antitoxin family protein [Planctomycetales bacterium]|nr:antitoxin family protein [Planctomycetales bacterium]
MKTVQAIYENGVFRPTEPVELPENCRVEFDPRLLNSPSDATSLDEVYAILSKRFKSGDHDVAERHNEHQP